MPAAPDDPAGTGVPPELSLDEAMAFAVKMHQKGALADAENVYRRILEAAPGFSGARHFLGLCLFQQGRRGEGLALALESAAEEPGNADWQSNAGNMLMQEKRYEEARERFSRAAALQPGHANALSNLGIALRALGRESESAEACRAAVAADPGHYAAQHNLGLACRGLGLHAEAAKAFLEAMRLEPRGTVISKKELGRAYTRLGEFEKAASVYREWLADEPRNPVPRHLLSAVTAQGVPERAPDDYVAAAFDDFADEFDQQLATLQYRAPEFMAEALDAANAGRQLDIIDAGCGTGLCGPLIKHHALSLIGVDLSGNMLKLAEPRGYDELHKAELTAFLAARKAACDCIISADTLCYFGALEEFSAAAAGALRAGGLLIFSVEAITDAGGGPGYVIQPHGRYKHRRGYVESALADAGFRIEAVREAVLRQERAKPVHGFIVTARKPLTAA